VAKPLVEFGSRGTRRDTHCRPCHSAYGKQHYAANRARYIDQARPDGPAATRAQAIPARVLPRAAFLGFGETDLIVLEFDHLRHKVSDISGGLSRRAWPSILAEIEKCEVVCANCHGRRPAAVEERSER